MTKVYEKTLTIKNELGLHARAATMFVQLASKFGAEVVVERGGREVNGKSIMGLLTLVASHGAQIKVRTEGEDGAEQLAALERLVDNRFEATEAP
jgi:phosphocarrier protein